MSDLLKMTGMIAGVGVAMYVMVQQHDYRIGKLESSVEQHLLKHERQNDEIQKTLTQIQIHLGGMSQAEEADHSAHSDTTLSKKSNTATFR